MQLDCAALAKRSLERRGAIIANFVVGKSELLEWTTASRLQAIGKKKSAFITNLAASEAQLLKGRRESLSQRASNGLSGALADFFEIS